MKKLFHCLLVIFLFFAFTATSCEVNNKVEIINIPQCITSVKIEITQGTVPAQNLNGIQNQNNAGKATIDKLATTLKGLGFDLSKAIHFKISLERHECPPDAKQVYEFDVMVKPDGDTTIDLK